MAKSPVAKQLVAKLPKWAAADEVMAAWVVEQIDDPINKAEADVYLRPWRIGPVIESGDDLKAAQERAAIEAAKRGDPRPLAGLFVHPHDPARSKPYTPSPEAAQVVADYLLGELRIDRRVKLKSHEDVFYNSAQHRAGRHVELVEKILFRNYPKEKGHREKAIDVVAKIRKLERGFVANYFKQRPRLLR